MLEIEQWIIQNNPHFFIRQLSKKEKSQTDIEQSIEDIKQAELELLAILESNQAEAEEEII